MPQYKVTIRAVVIKTLTVTADNEAEAAEEATEGFSILCEDEDEDYQQDISKIELVE